MVATWLPSATRKIRHLQPLLRGSIEVALPELLTAATGSTFPNAVRQAKLLDIPLPDLTVKQQQAIAHVLGTLDDKIELNRRMNETLEAMARALFKSWFVDFEPVRAKMDGRWLRGESLPGLLRRPPRPVPGPPGGLGAWARSRRGGRRRRWGS